MGDWNSRCTTTCQVHGGCNQGESWLELVQRSVRVDSRLLGGFSWQSELVSDLQARRCTATNKSQLCCQTDLKEVRFTKRRKDSAALILTKAVFLKSWDTIHTCGIQKRDSVVETSVYNHQGNTFLQNHVGKQRWDERKINFGISVQKTEQSISWHIVIFLNERHSYI